MLADGPEGVVLDCGGLPARLSFCDLLGELAASRDRA
jgi:hypothetical protein